MWLYLIAFGLVILGVLGGIFSGFIFMIILLPLAAIALICGLGFSMFARVAADKAQAADPSRPLPHQPAPAPGHVPSSPERLVDERRIRQ